jgi:SOS-response transcriptional repressor LexA
MKIDNPEVRVKVAENAAERSGPGQWEVICKDLDEDDSKMYRTAMVILAEVDNDQLDEAMAEIKENVGEKSAKFIRRYSKAYRETEVSMAKAVTVKKADVEVKKEEAPELTVEDRELIESIKKEIAENPTVATFDRYADMIKPWSSIKAQLATEAMGRDARVELARLKGIKTERHQQIEEAKKEIGAKIPKSEIEALREPGPNMWDIDVEIFYPIALGVVTGRIAAIGDAIEIFGWVFDGRGLSELVAVATLLMIEKYEGNMSKLMTFYSAIVVKLSKLHSSDVTIVAAEKARSRMETLLGIEDLAGDIMEQLASAVIEEGA